MWRSQLKMPFALVLGGAITMGLFGVMQMLISGDTVAATSEGINPSIRFGPIRIEPEPPKPIHRIPPKLEPPKEPPKPKKPVPTEASPPDISSPPDIFGPDIPVGPDGPGWVSMCGRYPGSCPSQGQDGEVIALVKIQPMYPRRAALMGLEGYVTLEFTITATGTVIDADVVDASPRRAFEKAALKAIYRWKFKPRYVEGIAVSRRARQTLEFNLD